MPEDSFLTWIAQQETKIMFSEEAKATKWKEGFWKCPDGAYWYALSRLEQVKLTDKEYDKILLRIESKDILDLPQVIDELMQIHEEQSEDPRKQIDLVFQSWRL